MARENRVPRRAADAPAGVTRHSLKGPGGAVAGIKKRRARVVATTTYDQAGVGNGRRGGQPIMVPTRWIKFAAALLLLPVCWVVSKTFFQEFHSVVIKGSYWRHEAFYFFSLGALLWGIAFAGLPRPLVLYVFGHELTHALWVWAQGGEVSEFRVGRDGGYIIADRRDFLVSLAPYFFPLYTILVVLVFGVAGYWCPVVWEYRRWLFAAVGATWAFHLTFTCWMITKQQTDLLLHGTFFSLVVIYLANLCVVAVLLVTACPGMSWASFGGHLRRNAEDFSDVVCEGAGLR